MHDQPYSRCVCSVAVLRWRQNVARTRKLHLSRMRVCQWLIIFSERHCHLWSKTEQTHGIVKSISPDTAPPPRQGTERRKEIKSPTIFLPLECLTELSTLFKYFLSRKASKLLHASNIFMVDLFRQSLNDFLKNETIIGKKNAWMHSKACCSVWRRNNSSLRNKD